MVGMKQCYCVYIMLLRLHIVTAYFWAGMIVVETFIGLLAKEGSEQELQFVDPARGNTLSLDFTWHFNGHNNGV